MLLTISHGIFYLLVLLKDLIHALLLNSWTLVGDSMMNFNVWKEVCITAD